MTRPDHDVVVVGGGPAGLATALGATRAGLDVAVFEPRTAPVDKACGEGLMPGGVAALRALGIDVEGRPIAGIRYVQGTRAAEADFRHGLGLGVRRTDLHAALDAAVAKAGIPVVPERVTRIAQDTSGVTVQGLRCRYLVAADGLHSPVRRMLGLDLPPSRGPARYGLRRHFAVPPDGDVPSYVEVHWGPRSEAYVTPVRRGLVGVALLTCERLPYDVQLAAFPALSGLCAEPMTDVRGAGPLRQRAARVVHGRVLLVGDAAGYVDALTGEGVASALKCAAGAVECLRRDDPAAYGPVWRRTTRTYRWLTHALVAGRRDPRTAALIVPLAQRLPALFTAVVDALA